MDGFLVAKLAFVFIFYFSIFVSQATRRVVIDVFCRQCVIFGAVIIVCVMKAWRRMKKRRRRRRRKLELLMLMMID